MQTYISIHAPPRGATGDEAEPSPEVIISIHAPPRGATNRAERRKAARDIFQFTPLREGRQCMAYGVSASAAFQFTPLREGRRRRSLQSGSKTNFNSRPSARGDCNMAGINTPDDNFNSRPSARGDACEDREAGWREIFQFTPLREGRRQTTSGLRTAENFNSRPSARGDLSMTKPARSSYFNSRPSARGDHGRKARMAECAISIHAPSARGDADKEENSGFFLTFQFTPLREGRRRGCGQGDGCRCISIHAPPRGATDGGVACRNRRVISIHAPPRGATSISALLCACCIFQFTPLREGRLWAKD